MNKTTGSFSVDTFTAAKTSIADYIDAAFGIGTPTIMTIHISINVQATDNGNQFQYHFAMTISVYHASTVNTVAETNIDAVLTEWEDVVTDSGKYASIAAGEIDGTISIVVIE